MPTLVSTGQITIIDQNDAKSITAFIGGSTQTQQIHTKNNGVITHNPDWATTNLTLTAYVYAGSTTNVASTLTNRKWSTTAGGTSLGTNATFVISANLAEDAAPVTYFFEGDYTDSTTGLVTKAITSIVVSQVKTGSNAVYVQVRGRAVIEEANSSTPSVIAIGADLIRSSGIDTDNLSYKWYEGNGATQIHATTGGNKYNAKATTGGSLPTGTYAEVIAASNLPDSGSGNTNNTLIISQNAVTDFAVFKVEITDSGENQTYSTFFTVFDTTDPYALEMVSSAGTVFKNGVGTTEIYPRVFNGSLEIGGVAGSTLNATPSQVADLQSWSFTYYFYDKDGKRAAFIDTNKTSLATGKPIGGSTAGSANTFSVTYTGTGITFAVGDIVKLVTSSGVAEYYEVATATSASPLSLRYNPTNTWLTWTSAPVLNAFNGGVLFACTANGTRVQTIAASGITTIAQAVAGRQITVSQYDIDAKGTITCEASRPI